MILFLSIYLVSAYIIRIIQVQDNWRKDQKWLPLLGCFLILLYVKEAFKHD